MQEDQQGCKKNVRAEEEQTITPQKSRREGKRMKPALLRTPEYMADNQIIMISR